MEENSEQIEEKRIVNGYAIEEIPPEAMDIGTLCRTKRFDRLAVIVPSKSKIRALGVDFIAYDPSKQPKR